MKKVFYTESGHGYTMNQVWSICDMYDKYGMFPEEFSEWDEAVFQDKYIKPLEDAFEDDLDPAGGRGLASHI